MKMLYFSFVFFLISSLFVFNGCYTAIFTDDRESSEYKSVIPDSSAGMVQHYSYGDYQLQTGWYLGYRYSPWYRYPYQYDPWRNLWIGPHWNGYRFGYWNHWYRHPYFYPHRYYPYSDNSWRRYPVWKPEERPNNSGRTRGNDGERGINRERPKSPQPPSIMNPSPKRTDGDRVRDRGEINKEPTRQATPPRGNKNTERTREKTVRPPQTNPDKEKSPAQKPAQSNPTRDREHK